MLLVFFMFKLKKLSHSKCLGGKRQDVWIVMKIMLPSTHGRFNESDGTLHVTYKKKPYKHHSSKRGQKQHG